MSKTTSQDNNKMNKSAVPSVEKAFDVIELLSDSRDGYTMNEIVDALGRTMGELYRIVVYLSERGYLEQDLNSNRYSLTMQLFELSHRFDPTERIIKNAVPLLERISARTDQSCHLGVLNRTSVLVLASIHSPRPAGYTVRTGALFPVRQTSTGSVILAFSADSVRKRHIARLPKEQKDAERESLSDIRSKGFDSRAGSLVEGVWSLSAPVFDGRGVVAAITSGYIRQPDQLASTEEALLEIRKAALKLSQSLGFQISGSEFEDCLSLD